MSMGLKHSLLGVLKLCLGLSHAISFFCRSIQTMSENKQEWKETPANIYKDSLPEFLKKEETAQEPVYFKPRAVRQRFKDLSWAQRNSKLVQGVLISSSLLIIFSRVIYDIYKSIVDPKLPTREDVQLHPKRRLGLQVREKVSWNSSKIINMVVNCFVFGHVQSNKQYVIIC